MQARRCPNHPDRSRSRDAHAHGPFRRFLARWVLFNSVLAGIFALAWLVLRSGTKPSRLAYPCQQAAFGTAAAAFGAPVVAAILALRRRVVTRLLSPRGMAVAGLGLITTLVMWGYLTQAPAYRGPTAQAPDSYMAEVFHKTGCPQDPVGDRFFCLDDLIEMMGARGLKLYRSDTPSLIAGPDGIVGADDVVVVKINYQWPERGGTNTDLLRGLIRRIVDHPDSFTGEVVVCENTQFAASQNFDRTSNNAQDTSLSPHDVVTAFQAAGHRVSQYDWTSIRGIQVNEYSAGDTTDGYVVYPYDAVMQGKISYPKFTTAHRNYVSLKYGVWDEARGYDRERLKFINLPVLKSHHSTYGATAMVKHYMGVVTTNLGTSAHTSMRYGLLGSLMSEIQLADLNILDAIWINANPYSGPSTTYAGATRVDRLVASLDPVAGDMWAVTNILTPAFVDNGYPPPWPSPSADPDDANSPFRQYLDSSMSYLVEAGYQVTNKLGQIDAVDLGPPGEASEPEGGGDPLRIARHADGYELSWSDPVRGGPLVEYELYRMPLPGGASTPHCVAGLGSATSVILPSLADDHGFLVVGRNAAGQGSFGRGSHGGERPAPLEVGVCP